MEKPRFHRLRRTEAANTRRQPYDERAAGPMRNRSRTVSSTPAPGRQPSFRCEAPAVKAVLRHTRAPRQNISEAASHKAPAGNPLKRCAAILAKVVSQIIGRSGGARDRRQTAANPTCGPVQKFGKGQFIEAEHPRAPAGQPEGGQFIEKGRAAFFETSLLQKDEPPDAPSVQWAEKLYEDALNTASFIAFSRNPSLARGFARGFLDSFFGDGLFSLPILAADVIGAQINSVLTLPKRAQQLFGKDLPSLGRRIGDVAGRYLTDSDEISEDVITSVQKGSQIAQEVEDQTRFLLRMGNELRQLTPYWMLQLFQNPADLEGHVSDEFLLLSLITHQAVDELKSLFDKAVNSDDETKAYVAAYIYGTVLYEVAELYVAQGTALATKSAKFARLLKRLEKIPFIQNHPQAKLAIGRLTSRLFRLLNTDACFVAGTLVQTPHGLAKIEELNIGDLVQTRREDAVAGKHHVEWQPVCRRIVTHPRHLWHITVQSAQGAIETLITTGVHPFFEVRRTAFVAAAALEIGHILLQRDGHFAEVVAIHVQQAPGKQRFTTYNLEIANGHTYFVGRCGIWVHNTGRLVCELLDQLYQTYQNAHHSEGLARAKLKRVLDQRVAKKKMTRKEADKHWKDAEKRFKGNKSTRPTKKELHNPRPNTLYESNGYYYHTDEEGRLAEVSGNLRLRPAKRNPYRQRKVGKSSGTEGDEGGHLIASQFYGPGEGPLHLVPQSMKLNRGSGSPWRIMENKWADSLKRGDKVVANIKMDWPPGATRPKSMTVRYEITNKRTGITTVHVESFPNQ